MEEYSFYHISNEDMVKIEAWLKEIEPEIMEIMKKDPSLSRHKEPYYGAIGGGLTYLFTPTGLGVVFEAEEYFTKNRLNLTKYDEW